MPNVEELAKKEDNSETTTADATKKDVDDSEDMDVDVVKDIATKDDNVIKQETEETDDVIKPSAADVEVKEEEQQTTTNVGGTAGGGARRSSRSGGSNTPNVRTTRGNLISRGSERGGTGGYICPGPGLNFTK